ncbi:hypothetical protein K438DRAFT_1965785 [Mycena galopus ATCC 62051]|nr:hypothetical protein K438DRAFT_1965785 [Mycena galopus ATCC 62051]
MPSTVSPSRCVLSRACVLYAAHQSVSPLKALHARPVCVLALPNPSAPDAEVLGIQRLPGRGDPGAAHAPRAARAQGTRRVPGRTYLSQPAPRAMLDLLAEAVTRCARLVSPLGPYLFPSSFIFYSLPCLPPRPRRGPRTAQPVHTAATAYLEQSRMRG